jgi:tryptophanyl-tRNA synthetase
MNQIKLLPGLDGRKMSKSYDNTIAISDSPEIIRDKVKTMITDPQRIRKTDPGNPNICSVYAFHKVFSTGIVQEVEESCKAGTIGCVQCKKQLADNMIAFMAPMYEKRIKLLEDKSKIIEILRTGTAKANIIAKQTMSEVYEKMNMLELE